jgi:hypothetical protein
MPLRLWRSGILQNSSESKYSISRVVLYASETPIADCRGEIGSERYIAFSVENACCRHYSRRFLTQ